MVAAGTSSASILGPGTTVYGLKLPAPAPSRFFLFFRQTGSFKIEPQSVRLYSSAREFEFCYIAIDKFAKFNDAMAIMRFEKTKQINKSKIHYITTK